MPRSARTFGDPTPSVRPGATPAFTVQSRATAMCAPKSSSIGVATRLAKLSIALLA